MWFVVEKFLGTVLKGTGDVPGALWQQRKQQHEQRCLAWVYSACCRVDFRLVELGFRFSLARLRWGTGPGNKPRIFFASRGLAFDTWTRQDWREIGEVVVVVVLSVGLEPALVTVTN